jgi:phosphoribosylaminoimidazolecarboxamide formyltransferase/IMP cyclohydrolase
MRTLPIRTSLLSVYDKTGLVDFARGLAGYGVTIYSTGGTAKLLRDAGIKLDEVSAVTGQAEIFGGRVKTLHPVIHAGILARRSVPEDMQMLARDGIRPIDLVCVNLYPFVATVDAHPDDVALAIENIDIGGPAMIRSAAKNHRDVVVITDPADYAAVLSDLAMHGGVPEERARALAVKAFQVTAAYDTAVQAHFAHAYAAEPLPVALSAGGARVQTLHYGENPHQKAAFYRHGRRHGLTAMDIVQGKELSYNNLLDLDSALRCVLEFQEPAAVVVKHTNPCGVAIASKLVAAYKAAREADPVSAFGGVIALNHPIDAATANEITSTFVECVIAPGADAEARALLAHKKNLRLALVDPWPKGDTAQIEVRSVLGGLLAQTSDAATAPETEWKVVSKRAPTAEELAGLRFAWRVVKHVKSNAIVFATKDRTLGIGAGQMSRVDSTRIAVSKARSPLQGSAVASDAFFPFRDGLDALAAAGATAVIQPGGSVRDQEVIAAADEHGLAMVLTGTRHFKH